MTREDLLTILRIGVHIAKSDDNLGPGEKKLLGQLVVGMKLTAEEKSELLSAGSTLSELISGLQSGEAVTMMVKTACAIANSDGEVDPSEVVALTKLIEQAHAKIDLLPTDQWGTYETAVIDAFNRYADV